MTKMIFLGACLLGQAGQEPGLQGDANLDTRVDFADVRHVLFNWLQPYEATDLNKIFANWTPEPTPIAHWVTIPSCSETVAQVIAAHVDGIDRVEFEYLDPATSTVTRTVVHEPVRRFDADVYEVQLGPGLVHATVHSASGASVRLKTIRIGVERGPEVHVPSQFPTIHDAVKFLRDNHGSVGRVMVASGSYTWPGGAGGLTAIQPGEGWLEVIGAEPNVQIEGTNGEIKTRRLRVANMTMYQSPVGNAYIGAERSIWFDGCTLLGTGPTHSINFNGGTTSWERKYYTNCGIHNVRHAPADVDQYRLCTFSNIGEDIFHSPDLVLSCTVHSLRKPSGTSYHPDLIQLRYYERNVLIDNLQAFNIHAQCIFQRGEGQPGEFTDGMCIRNSTINATLDNPYISQISLTAHHVILENVELNNQPMWFRHDRLYPTERGPTILSYVSLRDSRFSTLWIQEGIIDPDSPVLEELGP